MNHPATKSPARDWQGWAGQYVRLTFASDPFWGGLTLRWGWVREVTDCALIIDDYHDCAGIGDPVHGHTGVPVRFAAVVNIHAAAPPTTGPFRSTES